MIIGKERLFRSNVEMKDRKERRNLRRNCSRCDMFEVEKENVRASPLRGHFRGYESFARGAPFHDFGIITGFDTSRNGLPSTEGNRNHPLQ